MQYPSEWRCETAETALERAGEFGLYPEEMKRLSDAMPVEPHGGLILANVTLREAGTIGMAASIGHEGDRFCPGIYVFDARDGDALRWFASRRAAAEYYDTLVAATSGDDTTHA